MLSSYSELNRLPYDLVILVTDTPKSDMGYIESEVKVTEGSNVTLSCTFYSHPELESITWFDEDVTEGKPEFMTPTEDDKYTSTVTVLNVVSNTTITCVAVQITNDGLYEMTKTQVGDNMFTFYLISKYEHAYLTCELPHFAFDQFDYSSLWCFTLHAKFSYLNSTN